MNSLHDGISFNEKHSWRDYGMYLATAPDFGTPEPKTEYVDIPGRDGVLDYTESATGEVKYSNREMVFTFAKMIDPEYREQFRSELWNDLHGKTAEIIYDLDADWYYTGRCSVAFEDVMPWKLKIVITVDAKPYKLARDMSLITISPESFSAETIFLGKGTDAQNINSIFTFGSAGFPQLDLTQFSQLQFRWKYNTAWGEPTLQITDGDGVSYNDDLDAEIIGSGFYGKNLNISEITSITESRVYRILCQNRSHVELYGVTQASATIIIPVDRMTVVPVWTASDTVTAFVNGRKITVPQGASQNYNARLTEGENQVSFIADSEETTIDIQFTNGRL